MKAIHFAALLGAGALVASAWGSSPSDEPSPAHKPTNPGSAKGRAELERLLGLLPLDATQRTFLLFVAAGESGFKILATNDSPGEAAAAGDIYDNQSAHFESCGYPRSAWTWGSAGWFGLLVPVGLWNLRKTPFACWDPRTYLYDPAQSITAAIANGRALQNWQGFKSNPTVGNLRRGWGWPSAMGPNTPGPEKRAAYEARLVASGVAPPSFLDVEVPTFPSDSQGIYATLTNAIGVAA